MDELVWRMKEWLAPAFREEKLLYRWALKIYKILLAQSGRSKIKKLRHSGQLAEPYGLLRLETTGEYLVELVNGNKLFWPEPADPTNLLGIILLSRRGDYEANESRLFSLLVKAGDVVFDVGANFGWHSLDLIKRVGRKGRVYCFEPVAETYWELTKNIILNFPEWPNIILENLALGEREGKVAIYIPPELGPAFATVVSGTEGGERGLLASMITLDAYLRQHPLPKIDFIKCDIEGAQLLFVEGAAATLARYQPLLLLEVNEEDSREIFSVLREFGYEPHYFDGDCLQELKEEKGKLPALNFLFLQPQHLIKVEELWINQ